MRKPRLKSVFPPMPVDDGTIAIGGADYGLAARLEDDEQRHLWRLLGLLDGSRSMDEVVAAMRGDDPEVPGADIVAAIEALTEAGYVEDADAPALADFTAPERERYRRNFEFFSFFSRHPETGHDLQARLKRSRVTVLGVGGLGSYVALELAAAGVGDLLLVDDDLVEAHNLNRQILYSQGDVGTSKVAAAAARIALVNPLVEVTAMDKRVAGVDDARACFAGRDLVICAADRPRVTIYDWLNAASVAEGVAWIRGANDGLTVNTFMHVPGKTACFECEQRRALALYPWYASQLRFAKETVGDRTVNPCTAPVAGLIGSVTALEAIKFLSRAATPVTYDHKLTIDLQTLETRVTQGARDPQCPVCAEASQKTLPALIDGYVRTGKVKLQARTLHFIGNDSVRAARFAAGAEQQGRLWDFVDLFYKNQGPENSGYVTDAFIEDLATQIPGLDYAKMQADMSAPLVEQQLGEAQQQAAKFGVDSTPSFLIQIGDADPKPLGNQGSEFDEMSKRIDAALKEAEGS